MGLNEIMHKPTFVKKDMSLHDVAEIMAAKSIGSVLVGNAEKVLGIFSERDLLLKAVAKKADFCKANVSDYMSAPVKTIDVNSSIFDAQNMMIENHVRRVPITDNGKVVGIVSARNIMENLKYEYLKKSHEVNERNMYSAFW